MLQMMKNWKKMGILEWRIEDHEELWEISLGKKKSRLSFMCPGAERCYIDPSLLGES